MDFGRGYIIPFAKVDQALLDSQKVFTAYEKLTYVMLSRFLNEQNKEIVFPSLDLLMEMMDVSKPTVIKALRGLEEKGLIVVEKVSGNGINKRNIYHLKAYGEPVEKKEDEKIPFKEIISYLNEKAEKKFKHSSDVNQKNIRARWNEGFRLDDFKQVIDKKVAHWLKDPEMNQYLRPVTLFGTKFESYLNAIGTRPKQSGPSFPQQPKPTGGRVITEAERLEKLKGLGVEMD